MNNHRNSHPTQKCIVPPADEILSCGEHSFAFVYRSVFPFLRFQFGVVGLALVLAGCGNTSESASYHVNHVQAAYSVRSRIASPPAVEEVAADEPVTTHVETAEEKQNRLAAQLGLALAAKLGTRPDPDDGFGAAFAKALVSRGADAVIESTVDEAFEHQSSSVRQQVSLVLEAVFEGDLTLSTVGERSQKAELFDWLQARSPDAARDAKVIDFLYEVYQKGHAQ